MLCKVLASWMKSRLFLSRIQSVFQLYMVRLDGSSDARLVNGAMTSSETLSGAVRGGLGAARGRGISQPPGEFVSSKGQPEKSRCSISKGPRFTQVNYPDIHLPPLEHQFSLRPAKFGLRQYVDGKVPSLPPSTMRMLPFTYAPALEARYKTAPAISRSSPIFPSGMTDLSNANGCPGVPPKACTIGADISLGNTVQD